MDRHITEGWDVSLSQQYHGSGIEPALRRVAHQSVWKVTSITNSVHSDRPRYC
nr:hypothetical protein [Halocatena marina]